MVAYYAHLKRAVLSLPDPSLESRQILYSHAREGMLKRLKNAKPRATKTEIKKEEEELQRAINRIDKQFPVPKKPVGAVKKSTGNIIAEHKARMAAAVIAGTMLASGGFANVEASNHSERASYAGSLLNSARPYQIVGVPGGSIPFRTENESEVAEKEAASSSSRDEAPHRLEDLDLTMLSRAVDKNSYRKIIRMARILLSPESGISPTPRDILNLGDIIRSSQHAIDHISSLEFYPPELNDIYPGLEGIVKYVDSAVGAERFGDLIQYMKVLFEDINNIALCINHYNETVGNFTYDHPIFLTLMPPDNEPEIKPELFWKEFEALEGRLVSALGKEATIQELEKRLELLRGVIQTESETMQPAASSDELPPPVPDLTKEQVKAITAFLKANPWPGDRGTSIDWIRSNLHPWMPGLLAEHLLPDFRLYRSFRSMARLGKLPSDLDVPTGQENALRKLSPEGRAKLQATREVTTQRSRDSRARPAALPK